MNKAGAAVFVLLQYLLPKRLISGIVFRLTRVRLHWFKNLCIRVFCHLYPVRMDEALNPNIKDYASFNEFFTRELRRPYRPPDPVPIRGGAGRGHRGAAKTGVARRPGARFGSTSEQHLADLGVRPVDPVDQRRRMGTVVARWVPSPLRHTTTRYRSRGDAR